MPVQTYTMLVTLNTERPVDSLALERLVEDALAKDLCRKPPCAVTAHAFRGDLVEGARAGSPVDRAKQAHTDLRWDANKPKVLGSR